METTTLTLTVLRDAAKLTSIPYVQEAAGLALGIITLIQVNNACFYLRVACRLQVAQSPISARITKMHFSVLRMIFVASPMPL